MPDQSQHRAHAGGTASSSQNLETLLKWFPTGTAEGEKQILSSVFVYVKEVERLLRPPVGSPQLLIGKKGSGKSAVIEFTTKLLTRTSVPVLMLVPSEIDTSDLRPEDSTGDLSRKFQAILVSLIAARISENHQGLLTGHAGTLYSEAVKAGLRSPDGFSRFTRALVALSKPIVKADIGAMISALSIETQKNVETAIVSVLDEHSFYLFLDDTDQIANPDIPGHLNRIWGLILAVRALTQRISSLRVTVSLRSEVWERLSTEQPGQRDQTDHFSNLLVRVHSDRRQIGHIVDKRLGAACDAIKWRGDLYFPFFEGNGARAPDSPDFRSWKDLIVVRSRDRPRDAIQLVSTLAQYATRASRDKISEVDLKSVMPSFSEGRAELFAQEVERECKHALEIVRTFSEVDYAQGGFRSTADEMRAHLDRLPSRFGIVLHGITLRNGNQQDTFALWRFLYLSGVVNARVSDSAEPDGYRHVDPESDSMLVSPARWNDMQRILWEIHPAYRDFLISLQRERSSNLGLPVRRPSL